MVIVDSSALIPLAWVGRLDLLEEAFDDISTTNLVHSEVLTEGKRGTANLREFLEDVSIHEIPSDAGEVAELEGIAEADASVILLAAKNDEPLLANDKALLEVARSHGVDGWWITTLLLRSAKDDIVTAKEAKNILYDLVDEGMNLHPKVYTQVQRKLDELGS